MIIAGSSASIFDTRSPRRLAQGAVADASAARGMARSAVLDRVVAPRLGPPTSRGALAPFDGAFMPALAQRLGAPPAPVSREVLCEISAESEGWVEIELHFERS